MTAFFAAFAAFWKEVMKAEFWPKPAPHVLAPEFWA